MESMEKGLITLLKSSILQKSEVLPEGFDLEQAYPMVKKHHMASLIFDGANRCGISAQEPIMQKLFQSYYKALRVSEGQLRALKKLLTAFEENGIDHMPLKGCNMKSLYPAPELRMMGDADILIRMEQYEKIRPILQNLGFEEKQETDHELVWQSKGLYLELHKRLIPSYNKDLSPYFGDGWKLARPVGGCRYGMKPEDEWIFLFTHFAKHYRDGGIGCRHVVDLWVYLRSHPELDQAAVKQTLGELRLLAFYENILDLIEYWFHDGPGSEKLEYISEYIFNSGSWGADASRALSRAVRDSNRALPGVSGRMLYIWQVLFLPVDILKDKYTILKKHPWMLPLVWLVRPFYKVIFEWKTLKRQQMNLEALSEDNLENRRKLLNYVGLDYNF